MVHPSETLDPFLARALWIHRVRDGLDSEELALLVDVVGRGTSLIAGAGEGRTLRLIGPLGRPLSPAPGVRSLLLVAEGVAVAPFVWFSDEETRRGRNVTLLLGATEAAALYPLELVHPEVEVAVATDDGSAGARGSVTELVAEYAGWADQVFAAGPDRLYRELAATLRARVWRRPVQALANAPVPCGTGVCGGCFVASRRGGRLLCRDGPAFDMRELA